MYTVQYLLRDAFTIVLVMRVTYCVTYILYETYLVLRQAWTCGHADKAANHVIFSSHKLQYS